MTFPLPYFTRKENYYWYVVGTVCIGAFLALLDASIINMIMPTLHKDLNAPLSSVVWVAIAYLLTVTGLMVTFGRLADAVGRGRMYNLGFVVFIVGSALCGMAPSLAMLVVFRVLQGVGAAMLQTNSVALITQTTPPEKRGRSLGVQGAAQALGLAAGPTIGGLVVQYFGWRWFFYLSVPFGLLGALLAFLILPLERHKVELSFDYLGAFLFATVASLFLYTLTKGNDWGWGSELFLGMLFLSAVLFAAFYFWEKHSRDPLIDFTMFHNRTFTAGNISGMLSYVVLYGAMFLLPFYLEWVRMFQPSQVGLILTPIPLAIGVLAPFSGRLSDRLGSRGLSSVGMGCASAACLALSLLSPRASYLEILAVLLLLGVGLGLFTPPNNSAIMGAAPRDKLSVAGGILNMARALGMSLGVAVAGAVFAWGISFYRLAGLTGAREYDLAFRDGIWALAILGAVGVLVSLARSKQSQSMKGEPILLE